MDNDTISNQDDYQDQIDEQPNYLGNKREAETELNKEGFGKTDKNDEEEEFYKMKLVNKEIDSKLKKEAENLCRNLLIKTDEKDLKELNANILEIPSNQFPDIKNQNFANCNSKDKENVVKFGDFVILEKDGPDNESDIEEEEDLNKENSYLNQAGGNILPTNVNGNSFNLSKRNEIQKINTIIQNVEYYKTNLNKNVQRKCVCCDRSDLYPSEMLKFKTIEDFLIYFKFLYDKRVSALKTDEENFEKNRQVLSELSNSLQKIQKFNLKSVRYLCKTCLVTKLNQTEGLNFIYRAMEIHMILENFLNTNAANPNTNISANYSSMNLLNSNIKSAMEVNSPNTNQNSALNKKKNLFETKLKLDDNTPVDHQLIENLKMGLTANAHNGNLINTNKLGNFGSNLNDNKNSLSHSLHHSQIFNKLANAKEEESGNLLTSFENIIANAGNNNNGNHGNLNFTNSNLNMSNPSGINRGLDMFNMLNMNRMNQQNSVNAMGNPQSILQKIAEVQNNINHLNPMGISSLIQNNPTNSSNNLMNMNFNTLGPNNLTNITNFSNNFSQVVDAINSFNSKNINHNTNLVNSVSQLAGVLSNYINSEEGENNAASNAGKIHESNLEKDNQGDIKKENSGEKELGTNEDEKKEDVNVTNIIMNFDKAPILSYMMNVLEDLKKQIVAIQYYSLLQKYFISYIFKNLEVLMEQISNNQMFVNNQSINEFNNNSVIMNLFQKMGGGQNPNKGIENLLNMMPQNMNHNTNPIQSNPNLQMNMMNMPNLPDFSKKTDDGKLNPFMNNLNLNNPLELLKNLNNSSSNTNGVNQINMLNFLNNQNKNPPTQSCNVNMSGINSQSQNNHFNPNMSQPLPNQNTIPNINSNTILEHLLKTKGNQQLGSNCNIYNMQNISQLNNLMKQHNSTHTFLSNMPNIQMNNMIGIHGPSGGNLSNQLPGMGNIANLGSLNSSGVINNPLLLPHLQQGNNLPPFQINQTGNNQPFSTQQMFLSGLSNNMGNLKNINIPANNQSNELNNNINTANPQNHSKINIQNPNLPVNLLNILSQHQQNNEGNSQNQISDSNNNPIQGNEIENNLFKFINNQNNQNHPIFNPKSQEDLGVFNNLNSSINNMNNMNISNPEQLLQYLMMNQSHMGNTGLGNLKNDKYSEDINAKSNNE